MNLERKKVLAIDVAEEMIQSPYHLTVGELIEMLESYNPKMFVCIREENGTLKHLGLLTEIDNAAIG